MLPIPATCPMLNRHVPFPGNIRPRHEDLVSQQTSKTLKPCFQAAELALLDVLVDRLDRTCFRMESWISVRGVVQGRMLLYRGLIIGFRV